MAKIDFDEYQKIVNENLHSYNDKKDDNIKNKEVEKNDNDDEVLAKMLEFQKLMS